MFWLRVVTRNVLLTIMFGLRDVPRIPTLSFGVQNSDFQQALDGAPFLSAVR